MTDEERGGHSSIRVALLGDTADDVDVAALKKWLEREVSLERWVNDNTIRIHERPRTVDAGDAGDAGVTMGAGMDIVLVLIGAVTPGLFERVLAATESGVKAWRENRRSVEQGTPPVPEITPHAPPDGRADTPDRDPEAPDSEG
ncbi:hypothetical protein OG599_28010 [Streptomyces sp. NBC_01335]|uniref:hypothetical protein n=1 Tax=Streptomyces sp. NBC_01335 TaxID=2903828 RepID=UPI002E1138DE|nr:hypothetical protein OG599_28010 [Streptomyces sp. NBC_01335]